MGKFVIKKRPLNPEDNIRPISTSTRDGADEDDGRSVVKSLNSELPEERVRCNTKKISVNTPPTSKHFPGLCALVAQFCVTDYFMIVQLTDSMLAVMSIP